MPRPKKVIPEIEEQKVREAEEQHMRWLVSEGLILVGVVDSVEMTGPDQFKIEETIIPREPMKKRVEIDMVIDPSIDEPSVTIDGEELDLEDWDTP